MKCPKCQTENEIGAKVLGKSWVPKRMKAMRFSLINLPARVMERSRELLVRVSKYQPVFEWLLNIRRKIAMLALSA
jgi:hypothetical protein